MANSVLMPKLGDIMEEGTVVAWKKQVGQTVNQGEILLEVEMEKGIVEVESEFTGTLTRVLVEEGKTVPIGTILAEIE